MAQQVDHTEEGKETLQNVTDLKTISNNGLFVTLRCQKDGLYLYESENLHDYKSKGIHAFRACVHSKAAQWATRKAKWRVIDNKTHYMVQSVYRDAYLYDSESYTAFEHKGIKSSYVATHNLAYQWSDDSKTKPMWILQPIQGQNGCFALKSLWRDSYLYASDQATGYTDSQQNASFFAHGHPKALDWKNGAAIWRLDVAAE